MHLHAAPLVFLAAALGIPAASAASTTTTNAHDTYEELSRIPMIYRRAAFIQLDPETQSQVWQEHIKRYRNENRNYLSPNQGIRLEDVEEQVEKDFGVHKREHDQTPEDDRDVRSMETWHELVTDFGAEQAVKIFATLGPADDDDPDDSSASPSRESKRSREPECDCRVGLGRCVSNEDGTLCEASPSGCGVWWNEPCDGRRRA